MTGRCVSFLQHRDRGDVHGIAGIGLIGADAALAEHEIVVSAGENVLGGEQHLFDRGRDAALHQHRRTRMAELAQQIEVLHVARADLEAVDVRDHRLDLRDLHHLRDDQQTCLIRDFAQQLEAFEAHPWKL